MADEQIVTNIVAKADFSNLIADLQRVTSSVSKLQQEFAGSNRALAGQIAATNAMFSETMRRTGQYSTHFVSLTSDVEKFGKNLDSGRLKLRDYFRVYQENVRTHGGLIRDLAKQQVQLQNAVLQPLGRNAQGLMQYNVHIPRGLDLTRNKTAILKQELQIMNKVIQDGGVQLINWGKNTQWAGRQLTVGLTLPLVAFGKAAADAFKVADQELTRLTKVYGDIAGTSAQELTRVRKEVSATAKELSAAMGVNFAETIGLAADIAATGKTGNELLASVSETTRLAVLGEVDRQEAMKATLAIQSAFKSNTDELAQSINFLNAVENQTSTTLNDLVEAIPKAGPVIKGLGGSVQDLALYLTAMREGGVSASEGANALKSALASLINPTDVAVAKFEGFGIDLLGIVNNNAGNVTDTLFALQAALDRLDPLQKQQAIEQLFGKFQFSRLNALFENLGKQGSQTLQVLDLMKASAGELEAVAARELTAVTESASGRYRRAIEALKADLAGVGEDFLDIGTKLIKVLNGIIDFGQKLPDPVKKILAFGGAFTAVAGPIIMLTGVLANFFGYIIKGLGHFKALFKGAEGFKLLTPEIMAAQAAGSELADEFYTDARAADSLRIAIEKLNEDLILLQRNAGAAATASSGLGQTMATAAGTPVTVVGGGQRVSNPAHPLIGGQGRASAHLNPRDPNNPATIFGLTFQPEPLNRIIGRTPQVLMTERLPDVEGLTSVGGRSTGVVAGEHARYSALMATLGLLSQREVQELKKTIKFGGQVSSEFIATFDDILPITQDLAANAATQSAQIVAQLRAGKISVEQAKAAIIAVNADLERMMGQAVTTYGASRGRTIDLTKTPLINQPVVDASGKPNVRGMFRQGIFGQVMSAVGRATGTRTYGGPYSIETTTPAIPPGYVQSPSGLIIPGRNMGGEIFYNNGDQVPGPNVNADVVPAMLTPGEFVIRRDVAQQDPDGMRALNEGRAMIVPTFNRGGRIPGIQYRQLGGGIVSLLRALHASRSRVSGAMSLRNVERGGPSRSHRQIFERSGSNFQRISRTSGSGERGRYWSDLLDRGVITQKEYDDVISSISTIGQGRFVTAHAMPPSFLRRFGGSGAGTDYPEMRIGDIPSNIPGVNIGSRVLSRESEDMARLTPSSYATMPEFGGSQGVLQGYHMGSLGEFLLKTNLPAPLIRRILDAAARRMNQGNYSNKTNARLLYRDLAKAESQAIMEYADEINTALSMPFAANMGGRVPGYIRGGITRKWGKVHGGDDLSNTDPLHGPLQIGRFAGPRDTRTGRRGPTIQYKKPGQTSSVGAFLTGSLEDRGRFVTKEYMLGNYDVLRIPGAIEAMKAWGKKATGRFYRGVNLGKFSAGPAPLPPWLTAEIKYAQLSKDFSKIIGKEFIMRRSSWSSNPNIANEFGNFKIVADVKNRRVTPSSEMFPEIGFVPKSAQNKPKAKKVALARSEEESIFGGRFRIVKADKNGIEVETVAGPLGGNRRFGGQVNAGMPYVVGENGPELFVPRNSGGIIPGSKIKGYQRGGGILGTIGRFGLSSLGFMAGSALGGRFGQVGSMIGGIAGGALTDSLMFGGRDREEGVSRYDQKLAKLSSSSSKFSQSIAASATNGSKLSRVLVGLVGGLSKTNLAFGAAVAGAAALYKVYKDNAETQRLSALAFGLTADAAEKAGLKYTNYSNKIKDSVDSIQLLLDKNKLIYESLQSAGTPFDMTISQYKKLRKEVRETMKDQIEIFNQTDPKQVNQVAIQLKEQFVAAGMSADEATKKIYTLIKLSNKPTSAISAIGTKGFQGITDQQTAAVSAVGTFNMAKDFQNTRDQAAALNTALTAIDSGIANIMKTSEEAAKKDKTGKTEKISLYEAEKQQLDMINAKVKEQEPIGDAVLQNLIKQNPEIEKFAKGTDTVVSLWQKLRLQAAGFTGDLTNLNNKQVDQLYKLSVGVQEAVVNANKKGLLKEEYKNLDKLTARQKELMRAARGQSVKQQISDREAIKRIDERIKKINEEADARKKALQDQAEGESYQIELQKAQLDYQQALATGDMASAAQAQLRIRETVGQRQNQLAMDEVERQRQAKVKPLEDERSAIQDKQQKFADAAALAANELEKVNKELAAQTKEIDGVNGAMQRFKLALLANKDNLEAFKTTDEFKGLAAAFIDEARKAGKATPTANLPDVVGGKLQPENIGQAALDLMSSLDQGLSTALAEKGITTSGDIIINGEKLDTSTTGRFQRGSKKSPFEITGTYETDKKTKELTDAARRKIRDEYGIKADQYFTYGDKTYRVTGSNIEQAIAYVQKKASGGLISGPGTGTSDSIPAMLSSGEYVVSARAVQNVGVPMLDRINRMASGGLVTKYDMPKYTSGGRVMMAQGGQPPMLGGNIVMQNTYNIPQSLTKEEVGKYIVDLELRQLKRSGYGRSI